MDDFYYDKLEETDRMLDEFIRAKEALLSYAEMEYDRRLRQLQREYKTRMLELDRVFSTSIQNALSLSGEFIPEAVKKPKETNGENNE